MALMISAPLALVASDLVSSRTAIAPLSPAGDPAAVELRLPRPLGPEDALRYRMIFEVQKQGLWQSADRQIRKLRDRALLGHVLAQRYLHPTKYRTSYRELADWLARYADLPQAPRLYDLAMKRKPTGVVGPPQPPAAAERARPPENDVVEPGADWLAGLKAWSAGRFADAARRFERVATDRDSPAWEVAAGAYWAARSHLKEDRPRAANRWYATAAKHRDSFYGQLARRALGLDPGYDFRPQVMPPSASNRLAGTAAGYRALALLQVGETQRAEDELVGLHAREPSFAPLLASVSQAANMPALALNLAAEDRDAPWRDAMLYPIPSWRPEGGFTVDRAFLYALMRHESGFRPGAESPAGASGLMQLMPATADNVAGGIGTYSGGREYRLTDPVTNLTLGQRYVSRLLADPEVDGDLMRLVAAYNAGPGKLAKWLDDMGDAAKDPLLFVESLPSLETRTLVQRVMASLWIYRERLGQEAPSLDALSAGERPGYEPQDGAGVAVAQHGAD